MNIVPAIEGDPIRIIGTRGVQTIDEVVASHGNVGEDDATDSKRLGK